jgi:hypothetical protein
MIPRIYRVKDNRVQYISLVRHKNHTKWNYSERIEKSTFCDWCWVKVIMGKIWYHTGIKI